MDASVLLVDLIHANGQQARDLACHQSSASRLAHSNSFFPVPKHVFPRAVRCLPLSYATHPLQLLILIDARQSVVLPAGLGILLRISRRSVSLGLGRASLRKPFSFLCLRDGSGTGISTDDSDRPWPAAGVRWAGQDCSGRQRRSWRLHQQLSCLPPRVCGRSVDSVEERRSTRDAPARPPRLLDQYSGPWTVPTNASSRGP